MPLQDDFYLNLVSWSQTNLLAVGLSSCVYLWSAATSQVTRLADLSQSDGRNSDDSDSVTGLDWTNRVSSVLTYSRSALTVCDRGVRLQSVQAKVSSRSGMRRRKRNCER